MEKILSDIRTLKENLALVAFLVSKGDSEREAHGKIVESLVVVSQLEDKIKNNSTSCTSVERSPTLSTSQPHNEIKREIEKVRRRLPRWFKNPTQYNSTILISYLRLSSHNHKVSLQTLRNECSSVKDFDGNFNQMKNYGEKNHGKVFEEIDGYVTLWDPVKDYILKLYNENRLISSRHL